MKKVTFGILAAIMVFASFAVTSFATYSPKAKVALESIDIKKGAVVSFASSETNEYFEFYFKGSNVAVEISADKFDMKMISNDSTVYAYFTKFPFFYFELDAQPPIIDMEDFPFNSELLTDAEFIENYAKTVSNNAYNVEKYMIDFDYTIEFYFIEDELRIIEAYDSDGKSTKLELTESIDENKFKLPFFAINITTIINFFFSLA